MGGGGGKKKKKKSPPPQAQPLDYGALMRSANESAAAAAKAQVQAQIDAYPQLERLQLGTIQKIANNLNNQYTAEARAALARTITDTGDVRGIGQTLRDEAGETNIERQLREQAEADLALGRSLSAEETRDAQQAARAAFAARGLATSLGSSAAEILNRDSYAQARESDRRNFAAATNQMVTGNVTGRLGQAAGILGNAAQMDLANSTQQMAIDPYQRALGNAAIGSTLGGNLMRSTANTWQDAQQMAGNVAAFNASMLDARRAGYLNNQAALQAARISGGAAQQAGWMNMIGGLGMGAGSALSGTNFSDKRMKKDIKPVGKDGLLGLKTYEYRFKGEAKDAPKRIGYMAQEVAEVLPEAVEEVDYKGKRRLAIKPQVIGQALAAALTAEQEAMFAEGYTVR